MKKTILVIKDPTMLERSQPLQKLLKKTGCDPAYDEIEIVQVPNHGLDIVTQIETAKSWRKASSNGHVQYIFWDMAGAELLALMTARRSKKVWVKVWYTNTLALFRADGWDHIVLDDALKGNPTTKRLDPWEPVTAPECKCLSCKTELKQEEEV